MKSILFKLAAVAAISVMVSSAFAQGGGGGGGRGGFGQGRMGGGQGEIALVNRKDVSAELKITPDQKTKLEAAIQKMRDDQRAAREAGGGGNFQDMTDSERAKMAETRMAAEKKALESVLSKEQMDRLRQLVIQRLGNGAVNRPDVAKELGVTEDQKKKLADLQTKQREAMMAQFQNGGFQDMSQEERQAAMTKMRENMAKQNEIMNTEIGKILTKEQTDKLKAMGGAAFKFDPAEDNVGRRGGGGG
ncbi:MAG: hypothetical protein WAO58_05320 [Fimbriimonadaceae bacterium]